MSKTIAIVLACMIVLASASASRRDFEAFVAKYNKEYASEMEHEMRYQIFQENMNHVDMLNSVESDGATYGVTPFSDMSREEFERFYLTTLIAPQGEGDRMADLPTGDLPSSFDWRQKGAVTPVKNQGQCGSCWAFSTTGNVEGQWFLKHNQLVSLSEQQLVDCDKVDQGCNGGLPSNAYQYIQKAGGIEGESDYPYTALDGTCRFNSTLVKAKVTGWKAISKDEDQIAAALVATGPLSIGINAENMQHYTSGIADPLFCNPKGLDHGVLIVGFGSDPKPYWIIKNSWGPQWGESGYYRIIRGKGKCGLNEDVTTAEV